jgi:acyl-CoA dehydrogenase
VRLSPARLTHCMRWLGAARRAHDVATGYAARRQVFGKTLGEHQGVGFMLADNEMDMHTTRLCIWHCAWVLDQGHLGKHESSIAKVISSEAIWRVVDRSVQILGGQGVTHETVVETISTFKAEKVRPLPQRIDFPDQLTQSRKGEQYGNNNPRGCRAPHRRIASCG